MNITSHNYEEIFMLYADNELSAAERKEVEAFVAANPGMQEELALFQQFKINPDEAVVYNSKESLMKTEETAGMISMANYEAFFVLYADDELANHEKAAVEDFVYRHPQLQSSFELVQQVRLSPDASIVFTNKESLFRTEKDDRVVPFRWWRLAAAAMVLIAAGIFWLYQSKTTVQPGQIVKTTPAVTNPQPSPLHKEEGKIVTDTAGSRQASNDQVATTAPVKERQQAKHTAPEEKAVLVVKKKAGTATANKNNELALPAAQEETVASIEESKLKPSNISSIKNESAKQAAINTDIAAAASKSVNDHQLTYTDTDEKNSITATQAVAVNSDQLEVLNTSVNTKNSLRGLFRKASRMISKKTGSGEEDSKHKSILIGGFEIAVR